MEAFVEGSKVELVSLDGVYEGLIYNSRSDKLSLEKVKCQKTGRLLSGLLHFYSREIKKVTVLEEKCREVKKDDRLGPKLCHKKEVPRHIGNFRSTSRPCIKYLSPVESLNAESAVDTLLPRAQSFPVRTDVTAGCFGDMTRDKSEAGGTTKVTRDDRSDLKMPSSYSIIVERDEHFLSAIDHLQQQSIVGLAVEGVDIGRYGHLCWLQVGTREHVFIFDMIALGGSCFQHGLGDIISKDTLQKVVHDCRKMSDMFWHQYQVQMVNVFDTQVADIAVHQLRYRGELPFYAKSLSACLFEHLNLTTEQVFVYKIREENLKGDESMWMLRPASEVILDAAVKNVAFLLDLRITLLERMLSRFVDSVDIYLSVMRDASQDQYSKSSKLQSHLLPDELTNCEMHGRRCRALSEKLAEPECKSGSTDQQKEELPKSGDGRRGKATTRHHDDVIVTQDKVVSSDAPVTPKVVSVLTQDRAVPNDAPVTPKQDRPRSVIQRRSQAEPRVADPLISQSKAIHVSESHSDGVRTDDAADIQIVSNAVPADAVLTPATVASPSVEPDTTLVFIAGGHENIAKNGVQDATVTMSQQRGRGREYVKRNTAPDHNESHERGGDKEYLNRNTAPDHSESRQRGGDSSYSTGSSDNNDEYNMIPTPTSIRSGASSSSEQTRRSPQEVKKPARRKPANAAAAPKGVSKHKTAVPSGVGRATALQSCLHKLSVGDASNVGLANGSPTVSGQFNDMDSDVLMVNGRTLDNELGSVRVCVPGKTGLGRAAALARHST